MTTQAPPGPNLRSGRVHEVPAAAHAAGFLNRLLQSRGPGPDPSWPVSIRLRRADSPRGPPRHSWRRHTTALPYLEYSFDFWPAVLKIACLRFSEAFPMTIPLRLAAQSACGATVSPSSGRGFFLVRRQVSGAFGSLRGDPASVSPDRIGLAAPRAAVGTEGPACSTPRGPFTAAISNTFADMKNRLQPARSRPTAVVASPNGTLRESGPDRRETSPGSSAIVARRARRLDRRMQTCSERLRKQKHGGREQLARPRKFPQIVDDSG